MPSQIGHLREATESLRSPRAIGCRRVYVSETPPVRTREKWWPGHGVKPGVPLATRRAWRLPRGDKDEPTLGRGGFEYPRQELNLQPSGPQPPSCDRPRNLQYSTDGGILPKANLVGPSPTLSRSPVE
jgi:hypothetical protein